MACGALAGYGVSQEFSNGVSKHAPSKKREAEHPPPPRFGPAPLCHLVYTLEL